MRILFAFRSSERFLWAFSCFAIVFTLRASAGQKPSPKDRSSPSIEARAADLVSRMTLDEKVSQLVNHAPAIPRLGIPEYDYWSEGLHGVARSGYATSFPQAIGMAATWDAPLVGDIATVISIEARAKYNEAIRHDIHSINFGLTLWSPNINIFRDPRWGRGQETYGEDPYLTSRLGVAFVEGLQGSDPRYFRTIATPKHFAVHSGPESSRHRFNANPTPYELEDTYLPAFRATVTEAKAGSVMCAYNAVGGKPACANDFLLQQKLRRDWHFEGYVVSDCDAVGDLSEAAAQHYAVDKEHGAAAALLNGTDLDCGSTYLALGDAVRHGLLKESDLDLHLKRILSARMQLGLLDSKASTTYDAIPFRVVGSAPNAALALKAARESIVLLKNDHGILPLSSALHHIAVIGPNAASLSVLEGNYNAIAKDPVFPVDAIRSEFIGRNVMYAQGSPWAKGVKIVAPRTLFRTAVPANVEGLTAEYFSGTGFDGEPAVRRIDKQIDFDWNAAAPVPGVPFNSFSVRWTGEISVPQAGDYSFNVRLAHCGGCFNQDKYTVTLDGINVADFKDERGEHGKTLPFTMHFADTRPHHLRVQYSHASPLFGGGITLEWFPPIDRLREDAVALAKQSDVVLLFAGLSPEVEGEEKSLQIEGFSGGDRTDIVLPAAQEELLRAVAATGKPLVVVLLNGSALAVNWAQQHADSILEAWYPGEAGGRAIAETLDGKNNPAGRLPVTFYASIDQLPAFDDYSMANRTYRYFKGTPLYPFGFGLSYTTFAYFHTKLSSRQLSDGQTLVVETDVKNTGLRVGDEVAELYLTPPQTNVSPLRSLQGFQRVHLAPGESRHLVFRLGARQLSHVEPSGLRVVSAGEYGVSLGGEQPSPTSSNQMHFTITGRFELPR
jgi:beta-glucosidase